MRPVVQFPDAVQAVADYLRAGLAARGQDVHVGSKVPSTRPARFVRVERVGGQRDSVVTDRPRLDIHCWGEDEGAAWDLCTLCRALMGAMSGVHGAVTAYRPAEVGGPQLLEDASGQPRYAFAASVSLRGTAI